MIITINGTPGSGKSTIGKFLAKKFSLKFYSVGEIRRRIAEAFDLNIYEFNKIGEKHSFTDIFVDEMVKTLVRDKAIIDGRLAWHFFPSSIKILLLCDYTIAAKRVFLEKRKTEMRFKNVKEAKNSIIKRIKGDEKRYLKYYKIKNIYDLKHYDLIIDTTHLGKSEMCNLAFYSVKKLLN